MKALVLLMISVLSTTASAFAPGRYQSAQISAESDILILEADGRISVIGTRQVGGRGGYSDEAWVPYPTVCRNEELGKVVSVTSDYLVFQVQYIRLLESSHSRHTEHCQAYIDRANRHVQSQSVNKEIRLRDYKRVEETVAPIPNQVVMPRSETQPAIPSSLDTGYIRDMDVTARGLLDQYKKARYSLQGLKDQLEITNVLLRSEWAKIFKDGNRIDELNRIKSSLERSMYENMALQKRVPETMKTGCIEYWRHEDQLRDPTLLPDLRSMCQYLKNVPQ